MIYTICYLYLHLYGVILFEWWGHDLKKQTLHYSSDSRRCPTLVPCTQHQWNRSYPSMVQISAFQTFEFSAFTLYKRRAQPEPFTSNTYLPLDNLCNNAVSSSSAPHFRGLDQKKEERTSSARDFKYSGQEAKGKESKTRREKNGERKNREKRKHKKSNCSFCGKLYARASTLKVRQIRNFQSCQREFKKSREISPIFLAVYWCHLTDLMNYNKRNR